MRKNKTRDKYKISNFLGFPKKLPALSPPKSGFSKHKGFALVSAANAICKMAIFSWTEGLCAFRA